MTKWYPYYKLDENGNPSMAQQTYEPLISKDGKTFCKNFEWPNTYQYLDDKQRPYYTKEVVEWFFNNEIKNIEKFKDKTYSPEVLDVDLKKRQIYIRWYRETCNQVIYSGRDWPVNDWLEQIKKIIKDQIVEGCYKLTMYPHCHYIDNNNNMRSIDWYGCLPKKNPIIKEIYMKGIIHETALFRLHETGPSINGYLNLKTMFKRSLSTHVLWGDHNMNYIYKEIFDG